MMIPKGYERYFYQTFLPSFLNNLKNINKNLKGILNEITNSKFTQDEVDEILWVADEVVNEYRPHVKKLKLIAQKMLNYMETKK